MVILLSLILGGGELVLAPVNATVACFIPSAAALAAVFIVSRTKRYRGPWSIRESAVMERKERESEAPQAMTFHQAFLPYYCLTAITVLCLLVPPVNRQLNRWKLGFSYPQTVTGYGFVTAAEAFFSPIKPLTYAGTFLVLSSVISFLYYRKKGMSGRPIFGRCGAGPQKNASRLQLRFSVSLSCPSF